MTGGIGNGIRVLPYLQIEDDEIMLVAAGVCPPYGVRTHTCTGQFSLTRFAVTFKIADVCKMPSGRRAEDRDCRFCGEQLL